MTTREIIEIILIIIIFLSGFIPIVMGIVDSVRENRRLDQKEKDSAAKAALHQSV